MTGEAETDSANMGADGNERLTAWTGAALFLGFAAEGLTLLGLRQNLPWHMAIGFALVVPVALKIASTGYRFVRYYTKAPAYRRKGPPRPLLRILAPFLIANTVAILLTGILIMYAGPYRHLIQGLHKLSFLTWFLLTGVHVLAYLWRVPGLLLADLLGRGTRYRSTVVRVLLIAGSGALGAGLGAVFLPAIRAWIASR
jgi:hypothetical protein